MEIRRQSRMHLDDGHPNYDHQLVKGDEFVQRLSAAKQLSELLSPLTDGKHFDYRSFY